MDPPPTRPPGGTRPLRLDVVVLGLVVDVIAVVVLVGWARGNERLTAVRQGLDTMKPVTAVTMLVLGTTVAVAGWGWRRWRWVAAIGGALAVAVGAEQLVGALAGWRDPLSTALFADEVRAAGGERPGQMAPLTAFGVLLSGGATLALGFRRTRVTHVGAVVVAVLAAIAITGYVYGVSSLRSFGADAGTALLSAVCLMLIAVGLLRATPEHGLAAVAARGPGAAVLLRWGLPVVIAVPLAIGWLQLRGQDSEIFGDAVGEAILAVTASAAGGLVLWQCAVTVARYEQERTVARDALEDANAGLEAEVASRTAALRAVEEVQRESLDALEEGVAVITDELELLLMNRAARRLLGFEPHEITELWQSGRWETFREDGTPLPRAERPVARSLATGEPTTGVLVRWRAKDGTMVLLSVSTRPLLEDEKVRGLVIAFADVTATRTQPAGVPTRVDGEVDDEDEAATVGSVVPLHRVATPSRVRHRVLVASGEPAAARALRNDLAFAGYDVAVATTASTTPKAARQHRPDLVLVEDGPALDGIELITVLRNDPLSAHVPLLLLTDEASGAEAARAITAGAIDVLRRPVEMVELLARLEVALRTTTRTSDLVHLSRSLDRASRTDPLTGLLNRRGIDDQIDRTEGVGLRRNEPTSALAIDLDRFKSINDRFGHLAGDRALRAVADAITEGLRDDDVAGRWGGEEFVVILPGTDLAGAAAVAERMRAAVEGLSVADDEGTPFSLTISIGVAEAEQGQVGPAVAAADARLLAAKQQGRNRVCAG